MTKELWKYSISELLKGYKENSFSPTEVSIEIIKNINSNDKKLNTFVYFDEQNILNQAASCDAKYNKNQHRGLLEGIPISIKDLIVTKDMPTNRGSLTSSLPVNSDFDAPVVKKLKKQGAIILGKTASPEFGHKGTTQSLKHGNTNNPWNISLNSGGSSGGASAAVAAGFGPAAIGTDGGGSIRIPCSFCGVFGHKPTFGKVPAYPISPFGTIANLGPITRTAKDGAMIMNIIASPDMLDWYSLPEETLDYEGFQKDIRKKFNVGYSKFWGMEKYFDASLMDIEVANKIEKAISVLSNNGLQVKEKKSIEWPHNPLEIFMVMWQAGAANLARKIAISDYDKMEPSLLSLIEKGKHYTAFDLMDVESKRAENAIYMKQIFSDVDALIGPTLPVLAFSSENNVPKGFSEEELFSWLPFTYPFNLTKNPACNVNVNFSKSGLPVGMQIVADIYKDKTCFELAFFIEQVTDLGDRWPML